MSSPDCKRQKLAGDVNSVAKMSNVSPKKDSETQADNVTITASASNEGSVIDENAQTFEDVASLDGFVDRTMLIEELLQRKPTYVSMFAPSKFGKTINLGMIRLFCDIEDKNTKTKEDVAEDPTMQELRSNPSKNMKVLLRQFKDKQYEECLILKQEKFVIQHFGRHPVILFDFKNSRPENESQAIVTCAMQVRTAYFENQYLQKSKEFQSDDCEHALLKETCKIWCSYDDDDKLRKLSIKDVIDGLQDLIKSLRIHWGRNPVLLVDEIDKPCVAAMEFELSERQVREVETIITDVVYSILKSENEELKLQAALITGISKLRNSRMAPLDNTVKVYFLCDNRFSKYYGLTAQEVDSLVRKFYGSEGDAEIEKIISNIKSYYNGYYQRSSSGEKKEYARYCLFSVLSYIKQRNEDKNNVNLSFWTGGGFLIGKLVSLLKKSNIIMSAVQTLLYDDSGTIAIKYEPIANVEHLLGLYRKEMVPSPHVTFNFFLQRGYLAHNLEKPEEIVQGGMKIYLRIPNLEIKHIYCQMFELYHDSLPENIKLKFISCGQFFKSLPTVPTEHSTEFQENLDKLCEDLKCIFRDMKCETEASVCSYILTILKHYAEYEKGEMEYTVQYLDNDKQCHVHIDVWGRHGNFALIFEVKCNSDANGEPGKIGVKAKTSLAAVEDIVELLPGKLYPEDRSCSKAGTGRDLEVLKSSQIKNYLLVGLAVDGDYTTHMLVFRDNTDWKNVIQVNTENHVAELISTHLKSK